MTILESYIENLDNGNSLSVEKNIVEWMKREKSDTLLFWELRRIWYRLIGGDLIGTKEMIFELQEQFIEDFERNVGTKSRFYDNRLKKWGF